MNYIVTTTINKPVLLEKYAQDAQEHEHQYRIVVIGDLKTPPAVKEFCNKISNTVYFSPDDQAKQFGHLSIFDHLPFNSVQRRNLAYIYCLQQGMTADDVLITIDDDNFIKTPDYIGQHLANRTPSAETVTADAPTWFNPLATFYAEPVYPRGFSLFHYEVTPEPVTTAHDTTTTAISAGLWEKNPDVDAITNLIGLSSPCRVKRSEQMVVGQNILCPFNTQNTAYFAGFWLTAFLSPYLGRYDDIYSSYITKRIADHLGFTISFGQPVVTQDRNPHDYYRDLRQEAHGAAHLNTFVQFLYSVSLSSDSIIDCFQQLADGLHRQYPNTFYAADAHNLAQPWSLTKMAEGMKIWLDTLDELDVKTVQSAQQPAPHHVRTKKAAA